MSMSCIPNVVAPFGAVANVLLQRVRWLIKKRKKAPTSESDWHHQLLCVMSTVTQERLLTLSHLTRFLAGKIRKHISDNYS